MLKYRYLALLQGARLALLSLALSIFLPISLTTTKASADTAGSGNCLQTFTKTGTGNLDVTESDGFCFVAFKNTDAVNTQTVFTWSRPAGLNSVDVLVVGGGGGGGARHGGGGGGGGFVQVDGFQVSSASSISIGVGAGGGASTSYTGTSGQDSYFRSSSNGLTAKGGGFGANAANAGSGGSGGGAGSAQSPGGVTTQTQTTFSGTTINSISFGNSGAAGATDNNFGGDNNDYWAGGGGGGAGSAGETPRSNGTLTTSFGANTNATAVGGKGGDGRSVSWITSSIASSLSIGHTSSSTVYFSGGGGGGIGADGQAGGAGGLGGGATGTRIEAAGNAGMAFTGGGGGGSGFDDINKAGSTTTVNAAPAGAGGSGVVVIRYQVPQPSAPTITGITGGSGSLSVAFTAAVQAGVTVTGYKFSTNGGSTWSASTGNTSSPISITGLTNGVTYQVQIRSVSAYWDGVATPSTSAIAGVNCSVSQVVSGGFTIVSFTSIGECVWRVPDGVTTADILAVGGGGGGGSDGGSGGGGGALQYATNYSLSGISSLSVSIGAGGNGGTWAGGVFGAAGSATFIRNSGTAIFEAKGGSGGRGWTDQTTIPGGTSGTGGSFTSGQVGGLGPTGCLSNSNSGGTGTFTIGSSPSGTAPTNSITGSAVSYGGGGGGGSGFQTDNTGIARDGASGGGTNSGGRGSSYKKSADGSTTINGASPGQNGFANTGGGGGGGSACNAFVSSPQSAYDAANGVTQRTAGGNGGSGIVVIRYINAPAISLTATTINATIGSAVNSYSITNTGGAISSYSISPSFSLAGVTWSNSNGLISGTPTATASATTYTITAQNSSGSSTASFTISSNNPSCNPSSTSSGGYTTLTFTNSATCNWSVPNGISTAEVLVVGGGGGGGAGGYNRNAPTTTRGGGGGGGGGGGQVVSQTLTGLSAGSIAISVGTGGAGGNIGGRSGSGWGGSHGRDGGNSSITVGGSSISAAGGGQGIGGGFWALTSSGSTACNINRSFLYDGLTAYYIDGVGGRGGNSGSNTGGRPFCGSGSDITTGVGGAGAGGAGSASSSSNLTAISTSLQAGGAGTSSNLTGSSVEYGTGGAGGGGEGGGASPPLVGATGSRAGMGGNGGAGANSGTTSGDSTSIGAVGGAGAAGVVIVRYANVVNFTYDANNGTGTAPSGGSAQGGTSFTSAANPFSRTGYTFSGWNTAANGTGTSITANASNTMPISATSVTFFAQWTASAVSITTPNSGLSGTMGTAYSLSMSVSGGTGSGTYAITTGSLPGSVTLNTSTGVISGTPSTSGSFPITVRFTDASGAQATTSSFNITITSNVSTLSALTLSSGTLSPTFSSSTTSYTASVANNISSITVTPTRTDSGASITVNGTAVTSGSASGSINLDFGSNTITVVVTAASGAQTTTTITVTRALAAALTPTFGTPTATTDGFTVQISNYDNAYTWSGTATASGTVTISGTGLVTVSGVAPATSSTATITTARTGFTSGSATISRSSFAANSSLKVYFDATDINSHDPLGSSPNALNDLANTANQGGALSGTKIAGSGGATISVDTTTNSLSFPGGNNTTGPYVDLGDITTSGFAANGLTIDFEADFGAVNDWERVIDLGNQRTATVGESDNIFVSRFGNQNNLTIEVWRGNISQGLCMTVNNDSNNLSGMNRWTITIDGSTCRIWRNGVQQNVKIGVNGSSGLSQPYLPPVNATLQKNYIGRSNWTADTQFEGKIRYLRVYEGGFAFEQIPAVTLRTVTFNANSGTVSPSSIVTSGAIRLPTPTRTGFAFDGWFEASDFTSSKLGATYTPTQSTTINAQWTSSVSTLSALTLSSGTLSPTFSSSTTSYTASVANNISSITVTPTRTDSGASITVNGTAVTSGSASGSINLSVGSNTITVVVTAASGAQTTTTITVTRAAQVFTVTYAYNSATGGNSNASSDFTVGGTAITLPTPTRTGFTFGGWFEASDLSGSALGSSYSPTQSRTIYARWNCSPVSTSANGFTVLRFTPVGSCVWTSPSDVSAIEVAVVAGGGGGAFGNLGGGGGAGEVLISGSTSLTSGVVGGTSAISISPGSTFGVAVGSGGTSGAPSGATELSANWASQSTTASFGGNGSNSSFGEITAIGGGGGGGGGSVATTRAAGASGGSGGGGSGAVGGVGGAAGTSPTPSGWTSYRNRGADGTEGGGGGAGGAGSSTKGGAGITLWNIKLAGGGGGWGKPGAENSLTDTVLGGNGRLKTGDWPYAGTSPNFTSPGTANTGTGGGAGAPGGSGVVIVRYANVVNFTYDANSGTGTAPSGGSAQGGTSFASAANPFSRTGYTFSGWNTAANGSGTAITANASNTMPISATSVTFFAQWTSSISTLSSLSLSSGTLSPTFSSSTTSYTASVANNISSITVTPTRTDSGASITVNGTAVTSGSASGSINLSVGSNTITVVVTAQDGTSTSTYTITVTRAALLPQTVSITSTAPTTARVAGSTYSLTATGGDSGNSIIFSSKTTSICTVATATVSFVAAGTCTVAANQNGNTTYAAASEVTQSFTVAKGIPSLSSFANVTKTFGDSAFSLTAPTVANSLAGSFTYASGSTSVATISGSTVTIVGAGSSTITATFNPTASANYETATITMTLTVNSASALTPTFGTPTTTPDGFTVQINNFTTNSNNTNYQWAGSATESGTVTIGSTGLVTVAGVAPGTTSVLTITTTRTNYSTGSATVSGSSMAACLPTESTVNGYTVIRFLNTGTCAWRVPAGISNVDVLVVGGGGAGGSRSGGGGGAGGYIAGTQTLTAGITLTITVGAGGAGQNRTVHAPNGGDSSIVGIPAGALTALGGGGGGGASATGISRAGNTGGSGGGSTPTITGAANAGGAGTAGQGFKGGDAISASTFDNWPGGGGGGAGSAGQSPASNSIGGAGGAGVANSITGTNVCYATGGGGGLNVGQTGGAAGSCSGFAASVNGGSGTSGVDPLPTTPTANTGAGGGGSGWNGASDVIGGSGASGIVVIRYANTYTITYDYNGATSGNNTSTSSFTTGSTALTLPTPSKTGFTFGGWFEASNFSGTAIGNTYSPLATRTIYARWLESGLTPNFGTPTATADGFTVQITNFTTNNNNTNFTFAGTATANGTVAISNTGLVTVSGVASGTASTLTVTTTRTGYVTGSDTVTATSLERFTITYQYNGATGSNTSVNDTFTVSGTPITLPNPTRTGYSFGGWFEAIDLSGSALASTYSPTQSRTIYAKWNPNSLTVSYNSQGGSNVSSGSVNVGASISTAPTAPTRAGYSFTGWSATETGTVVVFPYAHGQTANFTLFGIWSANSLTVTFDSQSGSSVSNGSVTTDAKLTAPTAPIRAGYTFSGWSTTVGGSVVNFTGGYTHGQTANFTLYAVWSGVSCAPTQSTASGYTIYTFSTAGTCFWSVPVGVTDVEVLVVAGGGGGGYSWDNTGAGGGAGGQVRTGQATLSTTAEVTVGAGGAGGTTSARRGGAGENSSISSITALGGTGGCAARSACVTASQATALAAANGGAGGSGGASGRGGGGSNTTAAAPTTANGGNGTVSNFSGSSVTYGVGGAGGVPRGFSSSIVGAAGTANTGNGGAGASASNASGDVNGGAGAAGLVIARIANTLTVSFDSQSGSSVSDTSTVTGGAIAAAPADPTRSNYTFVGWFTATTGGSAISFPYTHGQTANFTLYARWALNTYSVAFNANNGSGTMASQTVSHGVAANLNPNQFTRANYVFHRWATNADGSGTTYNNLSQITLTAGTTLYAQWTANTYVVTFNYDNAQGGGGDSTPTASFTTGGSPIALPNPTKAGFNFAGWFSDAALTNSIGLAGANYSPNGTTLSLNAYAKWNAINYTFTYDANSADSGTVPTETSKQITQAVTVKANTGNLVRAGYTFGGWNTASNGTGTNYLSGSQLTVGSSNVLLYAKWNPETYTVTYNANGGSGNAQRNSNNVSGDSYTTGSSAILLPSAGTLTRTGYNFAGWNTSANGTGTNYDAGASYTTISNVIFYAKWNPITYTISYDGNGSTGGTQIPAGSFTTGQAQPYQVVANTFTKTAHVFGGWNTADNGTGTNYSPGATFTTLQNLTLYAIWIPQFTLHYARNGGAASSGSIPGDQLYTSGTSVGPLFSAMSRTGYNFAGWSNGSTNIVAGGNFTILADSVLTARWTPIDYTISYNSDGGSTPPDAFTRQIGQSFTVGSAVIKPGYNFTGWSDGTNVVGPGATVVVGSSPITYTAQWTPKVYQISYDWNGGSGTAVSDVSYTFGTPAITLPLVGDRVKDGYTFAGWSESLGGSALNATYIPTQSRTLYARWNIGNFTVTYNTNLGTLTDTNVQVVNGSSTVLPLPTRANFVFDGWYNASNGGSRIGMNGSSFTPNSSQTVYARWIQASLYGITDSLTRIGSVITQDNVANTFSGANSNSSVTVSIPENTFPAGTTVNFDLVGGNFNRARGVLPNLDYIVSIAVSWITASGTVPDANARNSNNAVSVTITNSSIKAGAEAFAIVNNVSTSLGRATQDGTITVRLISDPEIVVAATKPGAPTNVAATSNGNQQSVISWSEPSVTGGSPIIDYTVRSNTNASCTTSSTSCTISGLENGTSYTFTVTARNSVGVSDTSTATTATTASLYTVTFNSKGGSAVADGSFLTASTVSEPTAPTRTGYSFAGWSATETGTVVVFPYSPGVTSNITMFAKWDALDHVVTFDSKGGSAVADGVYSSGGSVSEPTAPTRSGFTFAGWSATDGGSAITFPYSPGATQAITLFARWTQVSNNQNNNQGGGGGSSNSSNQNNNSSSNSNNNSSNSSNSSGNSGVAETPRVSLPEVRVIGSTGTSLPTSQLPVIAKPGSAAEDKIQLMITRADQKVIEKLDIQDGKLKITPVPGFSGRRTVTVTIIEQGVTKTVDIPLVVLPEPVKAPVVTPVSAKKSTIDWKASPNAQRYEVFVNGKRVCVTSKTECEVRQVVGPNAKVEIVANGNDRTESDAKIATFELEAPLPVTKLVGSTRIKTTLTSVDKRNLESVISLINRQGFKVVYISQITTTRATQAAAAKRITAIQEYIMERTGNKELNFKVTEPKKKTFINQVSLSD